MILSTFVLLLIYGHFFPPTPEQLAEQERLKVLKQAQKQIASERSERRRRRRNAPARKAARQLASDEIFHGPINPALICPHCATKGKVHTQSVSKKQGISGAKATGALLTGGVSLLATGLSAKEKKTKALCGHCRSEWIF
ncbi:hypothetical protein [Novosphingobium sp. THN1]|uniref:hypothetical protein n=1 Tax=Novosphingobium sp. THN1 TaxID=1016987 RepID=UPI0013C31D3E|nr:hypothetical protein [Novosphingobium sp. THN1]